MKRLWIIGMVLLFLVVAGAVALALGQDLPVIKGQKAAATVNGEPISLEEYNRELVLVQQGEKSADGKGNAALLQRLINTQLVVQEARRMGLDELPEIKNRLDVFAKVTLRDMLMEKRVKEINVDEKAVDRLYKEEVKEWKIRSLAFDNEEAAVKMEQDLKAGKDFGQMAKELIADGKARGSAEGEYLKDKNLLPQVVEALSKMEVGSVSPVLRMKSGFAILKLEGVRYPEDPAARERAKQAVLRHQQAEVLRKYDEALKAKYSQIRQKVLDSLDYGPKGPGFEALLKDKRVVAEIKGEDPITVGELTEYIRQHLYHGVERAFQSNRLNSKKDRILQEVLQKGVFRKEALRLGIDKTADYQYRLKEHEKSLLFGAFVQKALVPDVKIREEDLKAFYKAHTQELVLPEMMRIRSLVFAKREDAEAVIIKLRKGTDFQWLMANADGQVHRVTRNLLDFDGKLLTTKDLPNEISKVVSGARAGDVRLYRSPEGYYYVLAIQEAFPSKPQPYEAARESIAKSVFNEKLKEALEDYTGKLRKVSEIRIYLKNGY
jgi:parvulin-like peptidyl-prolyl isomerase